VSTTLRSVISLVVVLGIAYVLISPLPEVDATFSGKSALSFFILVPYAFLATFFFTSSLNFRADEIAGTEQGDVIDLLCARLC
jgi:hypothetical protein